MGNEASGSAVCSECRWTNVSLLNLGEPGKPRMVCHGCCKRMLEAVDTCRTALKPNTHITGACAAFFIGELRVETKTYNKLYSKNEGKII